ncbi:unnamed protein product, partial [Phaeothamnion confervicola]
ILVWWRDRGVEFPKLALLARRVLCIPATSASSERLFSVAGQVVTKKRNRLSEQSVETLVFLHNALPAV